jgi:hypothetical protein
MLLANEDPAKVGRASKANSLAYQPALEKIAGFDINWNILAYPSAAWAKQVFPDDAEDGGRQAGGGDLRGLAHRTRPTRSPPGRAYAALQPAATG